MPWTNVQNFTIKMKMITIAIAKLEKWKNYKVCNREKSKIAIVLSEKLTSQYIFLLISGLANTIKDYLKL